MLFSSRTLLAVASLLGSTCAFDLRGKIPWNEFCSGINDLGHAKAILDNGKAYSGGVTKNGDFVIPNVAPGTYVLSVIAHDHIFDQLRVDVPADAETSAILPEIRPYIPGTPLTTQSNVLLPYPAILNARTKHSYYQAPASFDVLSMLNSPMTLMMIAAGVMMFMMPTLMKNMDPDSLAEFNERHAQMTGIQQSLASGDLKAGISQLIDASEDKSAAASTGVAPSPARGKGGKAKRR